MDKLTRVRHIGGFLTQDDSTETISVDGEVLTKKDFTPNGFDIPLYEFADRGTWNIYSQHALAKTTDVMDCKTDTLDIESSNNGDMFRYYEFVAYSDQSTWYFPMKVHPYGDNGYVEDRIVNISSNIHDTDYFTNVSYAIRSADGNMYVIFDPENPDLGIGWSEGVFYVTIKRTFTRAIPFGTITKIDATEDGKPPMLLKDWVEDCLPATKYLFNLGYYFLADVSSINFTSFKTKTYINVDTNDRFFIYSSNDSVRLNDKVITQPNYEYLPSNKITVEKNSSAHAYNTGVVYIDFENQGTYPIMYNFVNANLNVDWWYLNFDANNEAHIVDTPLIAYMIIEDVETDWEIITTGGLSISQNVGHPTSDNTRFFITVSIGGNTQNFTIAYTITLAVSGEPPREYTIYQAPPSSNP